MAHLVVCNITVILIFPLYEEVLKDLFSASLVDMDVVVSGIPTVIPRTEF